MTTVLVGVNGTPGAPALVDLAATEAARRQARLVIAHVWPGRYAKPFRRRGPLPTRDDAGGLLAVAAARAGRAAPGLPVTTELLEGAAGDRLLTASERACLMVVGHRDEASSGWSWGSTAAYLAHHSRCPVLVHRGSTADRGPVVAAISARPGETATVAYAFAEADRRDAALVAAHVWASGPGTTAGRRADRVLDEALAPWSAAYPRVRTERLVLPDTDLAYTIARASNRGRLLVAGIGQSGRSAELLYGSEVTALGRRPVCPVLLVPPAWGPPGPEPPRCIPPYEKQPVTQRGQ